MNTDLTFITNEKGKNFKQVLEEYTKLNPLCVKTFQELKGKETCFGWEEPLLKLVK